MGKSLLGALVLATFRNGRGDLVQRPGVVVRDNGETCNLQVSVDGSNDFPSGGPTNGLLWLTSQRQAPTGSEPLEGHFVLSCIERDVDLLLAHCEPLAHKERVALEELTALGPTTAAGTDQVAAPAPTKTEAAPADAPANSGTLE